MTKPDKKIFSVLFFSLTTAVTGVGIVVPLLPVYAHNLGAGGIYIGLIFGAFSLSRTFFLPYFGRLSDRKGRKPFIVVGLFCYALISFAFMFCTSMESLITIRFLQGIASAMMMPVILAYVGDITPMGREGRTMGIFNTSMFLGLSLGPLLGGVIKDHLGLQAAFGCMGVLSFISFFLSIYCLPPRRLEKAVTRVPSPASWKKILKDRQVCGFFFFRFSYAACIGILWGFLPVIATTRFSLSSSAIGFLVMLGVFVSGVMHPVMGFAADRFNRVFLATIGGAIVCAAIYAFGRTSGFGTLLAASIVFGIGGGVSMPALMALAVAKGTATGAMGSIMSLLTMAHSLGMLTGAMLAGFLMDFMGIQFAFPMGAAIMVMGGGIFLLCCKPCKKRQTQNHPEILKP